MFQADPPPLILLTAVMAGTWALPESTAAGLPRRFRRSINIGSSLKFTASLSVTLPLPDLGTKLRVAAPFSYDIELPNNDAAAAGKSDYSQYGYDNSWDNYYGNYLYNSNENNLNYTNRVYRRSVSVDGSGNKLTAGLEAAEAVAAWLGEWRQRKEILETLTSAMGQPIWWSELLSVPVQQGGSGQTARMKPDGHACLERAVCEVAAYPTHNHGLVGDLLNFMLNVKLLQRQPDSLMAKLLSEEAPAGFDPISEWRLACYSRAQLVGQSNGHCLSYEDTCPYSFFTIHDVEKHF